MVGGGNFTNTYEFEILKYPVIPNKLQVQKFSTTVCEAISSSCKDVFLLTGQHQ